jgi:predicted RNA-binding protein Jag
MKTCRLCGKETKDVESLNVYIIDFILKDNKKKNNISIDIDNYHINNGSNLIHGKINSAYYCENCKKILLNLDQC